VSAEERELKDPECWSERNKGEEKEMDGRHRDHVKK
jgi:hypothetical protein